MKLHLKNLVKAGSKLWQGSDRKGSYLLPEYEIEQGPQKGKKITTKNMMLSCWMKETGAMASVNEIVGTMQELNIDPSIPYIMNPKLKNPTLDDTAEIVLSYEKFNSCQKASNAYYAKEAAAKAAALEKEQVADADDMGEAKGNDDMDVHMADAEGGADDEKDSAKAAVDSASSLSQMPKGAAPTIGKATTEKAGSTDANAKKRKLGEKETLNNKDITTEGEHETLPDEEEPNIAPEKFAWICDRCEVAKFRTRDEANAHEVTCTGVFDPETPAKGASGVQASSVTPSPVKFDLGLLNVCDDLLLALDWDETKMLLDKVVGMAKNWTLAEWDQNWRRVEDDVHHEDLFQAAKARVPVPKE